MRIPRVTDLVKGLILPAAAAVILAVSCSSRVDNPDALFDRMVGAYGGKEKIGELTTFTGRGFMKKISSVQVAESYPFDVYQDGELVKNRIVNVEGGRMIDARILVIDKVEGYQYSVSGGMSGINRWEKGLVKYRFPGLLAWIPESGLKGELLEARAGETDYRLKYENGDDIITYTIDGKTFLLKGNEVKSRADSAFVITDLYGDYLRMDDTWFPSRFSGFFGERQYYEYFLTRVDLWTKFPDGFFAVLPEDTAGIQYYTPPQQ